MSQQRIKYKVTNWSEYNKSLIHRGQVTLWLDEAVKDSWLNTDLTGTRGRPNFYSDLAIEVCLNIRYVLNLPLRATQGFVMSLLKLMDLNLPCPNYTRLCRRSKELSIKLRRLPNKEGSIDIVVDSTGLKVYGEGEWKVRKHGSSKRRTWKKLHLAVDPLDHEIVSAVLTDNDCSDDHAFEPLVDPIEDDVDYCYGDGAYDRELCYNICKEKNITLIVPPRRKAVLSDNPAKTLRNRAIERIQALGGDDDARAQWKIESDYHTRSLAENAMFRFKTICGDTLRSRNELNQITEADIKVNILNTFNKIGMPISQPVI